MLVAVYHRNDDIRLKEIPKPEIGPHEILLKIMACGLCGSDVLEWYRIPKAPTVLGHEATGIIEEVGRKVTAYKQGDRVFVSHHVPCNECKYCLNDYQTACETLHKTNYYPGGFSQYVRVPEINVKNGVYRLPDNMSYEEGTFIEPLGCVVRGQSLASIHDGDTVIIFGSGTSGILHTQLSMVKGARKISVVDINPFRLSLAKQFGADETMIARGRDERGEPVNGIKKADKVIICTGAPQASYSAFNCVEKGGTILFFAVPKPDAGILIPINEFWRNEVKIKTSYGAAPRDLEESLRLLSHRKINVVDMITHRLNLQEIGKAFSIVERAKKSLKVIVEPNRSQSY